MKKIIAAIIFLSWACAWGGEAEVDAAAAPTPMQKAEARKREYAALRKEVEATRPAPGASNEEIGAYLEQALDSYGRFARENTKTVEGFEAASYLAGLLNSVHHPQSLKYALLAVDTAPPVGVDLQRVATCWALAAEAYLNKGDTENAKVAVEKIKALDKPMYEKLRVELEKAIAQLAAMHAATERLQPGKEPLPLEGKDLQGRPVSIPALKGKVVIIDFWSTWCGPCMAEVPNMVELYEQQKSHGLAIIGVSLDSDEEELKKAIAENGITWPVIFSPTSQDGSLARNWNIQAIPSTFLLDKKGVIRNVNLRGKELNEAVAKLIEEKN
jgi:peroxiredoxin